MNSLRIYLPGLNGVRFIAAFLVILNHLEFLKPFFGVPALCSGAFSANLGTTGVTVFFVLSGYLITYLLLQEKKISGIQIRNFYIRRILRIWPLYFLVLALAFFVLPHLPFFDVPGQANNVSQHFSEKLLLFVFLLANAAFVYYPVPIYGNILWSVAVEEQFYLFWPLLVKKIKRIGLMLVVALLTYLVFKLAVTFNVFGLDHTAAANLYNLVDHTRFSCMILGGMGAYLLYSQHKSLSLIHHPLTQLGAFCFFALVISNICTHPYYLLVKNEITALATIVLLLNISTNPRSIIRMENKSFNFLGRISYGMYMYHTLAVVASIRLFLPFYFNGSLPPVAWHLLVFFSTFLLTVGISFLSYHFFEKRILQQKQKYSTVLSGEPAKTQKS